MRRGGESPAASSRLFGEARCVTDQPNFRDIYGQHAGSTGRIALFSLGVEKQTFMQAVRRKTNRRLCIGPIFVSHRTMIGSVYLFLRE
jgi:hypothetical protein